MITYRSLSRTPKAFRSLTGLSVPAFDALAASGCMPMRCGVAPPRTHARAMLRGSAPPVGGGPTLSAKSE